MKVQSGRPCGEFPDHFWHAGISSSHCDENWLTRRVQVERTIGNDVKTLGLSVEDRGVWRSSGQELHEIHGCSDVDLAVTPATNTLPIRRLNLEVGSRESVIAAWVKFPELEIQLLSQRYTRLATNIYRYESNTGFSAEIVVDDLGLVTTYPEARIVSSHCRIRPDELELFTSHTNPNVPTIGRTSGTA